MGADAEYVLVFNDEKSAKRIFNLLGHREYTQTYERDDGTFFSYCLFDATLSGSNLHIGSLGRYYDEYYPRGNMRFLYEIYSYMVGICFAYGVKCVIHYVSDYMQCDDSGSVVILTHDTAVDTTKMKRLLKHYIKYSEVDDEEE